MQNSQPRRLTRSRDQMLAGVAGGLADYFSLDPTIVRILFVISGFVSFGVAILAYIILAIVLPPAGSNDQPPSGGGTIDDPAARAAGLSDSRGMDGGVIVGIVLVAAGFLVLFNGFEMLHWFGWRLFDFWWPAILITAGLAVIFMRRD